MKLIAALAAAALAMVAAAQPQDWGDNKDEWASAPEYAQSRALCRAVRDREPPAADRPDAASARTLRGCDSEALYYGIGMEPDPVRARQCAFLEAQTEETDVPFAGRAMLMTIYANGVGAERDLDVATHLACQTGWAPAESHGRVSRLAELKAEGWTGTDFDYCDHVTSGYAIGWCAGHAARIAAAERAAALAEIGSGWGPAEKQAFARLDAAHDAYAEAHADGEVDMAGTWRALFWTDAREAVEEELIGLLRRLAASGAAADGSAQLQVADAELNAAYREVMGGEFGDYPGAVRKEGVRVAQRAWLRYRDAFLAFAAIAYPRVGPDTVATWLTRRRTEMLRAKEDAP